MARNVKEGEWKFSIPDAFGRVCLQGVCKVAIDPFDNPYLKPIFSGLSIGMFVNT